MSYHYDMKILLDVKTKARGRGGITRDITLRSERDFAFRAAKDGVVSSFEGTQYVLAHAEEVKHKLSDKTLEDGMAVLANDFGVIFFWKRAKDGTDEGAAPEPAGWEVTGANLDDVYPSLSEAVEAAFESVIGHYQKSAQEHEHRATELRQKVRKAKNIADTLGIGQEDPDDDEEEELDDDD